LSVICCKSVAFTEYFKKTAPLKTDRHDLYIKEILLKSALTDLTHVIPLLRQCQEQFIYSGWSSSLLATLLPKSCLICPLSRERAMITAYKPEFENRKYVLRSSFVNSNCSITWELDEQVRLHPKTIFKLRSQK